MYRLGIYLLILLQILMPLAATLLALQPPAQQMAQNIQPQLATSWLGRQTGATLATLAQQWESMAGSPKVAQAATIWTSVSGASIDNAKTGTFAGGALALCVICSITNESNVVDANTTTKGTIQLTTAALGAGGQIGLNLNHTFPSGTRIGFLVDTGNNLLDLSLVPTIKIKTYTGNTAHETYTLTDLLTLDLLSGAKYYVSFVPTTAFDTVQIIYQASVTLLGSLDVYDVVTGAEAPTATPTNTPTATATNTAVPPTNTPTLTPTVTNTPVTDNVPPVAPIITTPTDSSTMSANLPTFGGMSELDSTVTVKL